MSVTTLLAVSLLVASAVQAGPVLTDVIQNGSRNIWIPLGDAAIITRLAAHGFNCATAATWFLTDVNSDADPQESFILRESDLSAGKLESIRAQARESARLGLLYMPYINQLADHEVRLLQGRQYRHVVNHLGTEGGIAPCPLERKDWFGLQLPQMLAIARVLAEEGCEGGVMLECETYCAGDIYPGYHSQRQHFCYCDHCWELFRAKLDPERRPPAHLRPAERYPWLSTRGLLLAYEHSEREELTALLRELAAVVRQVKPDCLFGVYPATLTWYGDAVVQGLSAPGLPVMVFSGSEYFSGYQRHMGRFWTWASNYSSTDTIRHLRRLGAPHLYLGGLSVGTYWPERMGLEMTRLLRETDGFWLYWGGTLLAADGTIGIVPEGGGEYVLRQQPSTFWPFIATANAAMRDRTSARGSAFADRPTVEVWPDVAFFGPQAEALVWDVTRPPTRERGWVIDGLEPAADAGAGGLVFDLCRDTPGPKALALDYPFQQGAQEYLFGVRLRFLGPAEGARISLGHSWTGYTEGDGRQIYAYINFVVTPEDGTVTLWRHLSVPREQPPTSWARLYVHPNRGQVVVERVVLAPAHTSDRLSQEVQLPADRDWGRVTWELEGASEGIFTLDVLDADTGHVLYADVPDGLDLGDISHLYGLRHLRLEATCTLPAGSHARLKWLRLEGPG